MAEDRRQLIEQARTARHGGDTAGALAFYLRAERASPEDPSARAHCLRHIGDLEREHGRIDAARAALAEAERLYRGLPGETLSLANTVRLRALLDGEAQAWREARALYSRAADEQSLDLGAALDECDRHLAGD
jgi:tetratricopeptide (TPR) repeat protein